MTPQPGTDRAAYIQGWLKVLKEDKRAIFSAANFLHGLQSIADTKEVAAAQATVSFVPGENLRPPGAGAEHL
ncbi:zincin-like metallopeptidase domain-containing protein [Agrobacterium tumefaciens]|uniref:zincin-like metallopeptidase domain-containing protein n=1 Tax=Agrobacterium tumefaciens TaxID=358 RepID=UPI003F527FB5